jgi:hypothetical protein
LEEAKAWLDEQGGGTIKKQNAKVILALQLQALRYFLDNQVPGGLVLDRQANHRPSRTSGWCSTAGTGMGLVALALATADPYRLLEPAEAVRRIQVALETALDRLPHDHGMMPHFLDAATGEARGYDAISTVDSSWLVAGGLWAAAFLRDAALEDLAGRLYDRVDWLYWTAPALDPRGLVRHGKGSDGRFLPSSWDRLNGETVFLYVLGAGAAPDRALPPKSWTALRPFYGTVAGLRFNNADLGLYVFEYGLDLLDFRRWRHPGGVDLAAEARLATRANYLFCREQGQTFLTYRRFWGLSDGDGPGDLSGTDAYRTYGPGYPVDGTAHLMATLPAVANAPAEVLDNLMQADRDPALGARGRYGFSNVNLDRHWVGQDVLGIDTGAAVLALDNYLMEDRVRRVFHGLPCVFRGLQRLGFTPAEPGAPENP